MNFHKNHKLADFEKSGNQRRVTEVVSDLRPISLSSESTTQKIELVLIVILLSQ